MLPGAPTIVCRIVNARISQCPRYAGALSFSATGVRIYTLFALPAGRLGPAQRSDGVVVVTVDGHKAVVVGLLRRVTSAERGAAESQSARKKQFEEQSFEFFTEYHINNEIYGRIDRHHKVASLYEYVDCFEPESFEKVRRQCYQIAQQENDDYA